MRKYKLKELRELVRLGVAEDYTNKPSEYIYTQGICKNGNIKAVEACILYC